MSKEIKEQLESIQISFERTLEGNLSDGSKLALVCTQFTGMLVVAGVMVDLIDEVADD